MLCDVCKKQEATIKHHIRYFPEQTIPVCKDCHDDIHDGKHPELIRYRPGDAQMFYQGQERIARFIKRFFHH